MIGLLVQGLLLAAAPTSAPHKAELSTQWPPASFAIRDVYWRCREGICLAGESGSRPAVVCAALAKRVGPVRSFEAEGVPFNKTSLDRCNAAAR